MPAADPLVGHPYVDGKMRAMLYDWVMEVCQDFALKRETFAAAVNLCDRFLGKVRLGSSILPRFRCIRAVLWALQTAIGGFCSLFLRLRPADCRFRASVARHSGWRATAIFELRDRAFSVLCADQGRSSHQAATGGRHSYVHII